MAIGDKKPVVMDADVGASGGVAAYDATQAALAARAKAEGVAAVENGSTAASAHEAGEYIARNGLFYCVTVPIAAGDALAVGTNIEGTTIAAVLTALNTSLSKKAEESDMVAGFAVRPVALTADITYYVDAANGNDDNDGLSSSAPLATIMHAINLLPKNLGGRTATVYVAAGTYDENVVIENFNNGFLNILCTTIWGVYINGYLRVLSCGAAFYMENSTIKQAYGVFYAFFQSCPNICLLNVSARPDAQASDTWGWFFQDCPSIIGGIQAWNVANGIQLHRSNITMATYLSAQSTGAWVSYSSALIDGTVGGTTQFIKGDGAFIIHGGVIK